MDDEILEMRRKIKEEQESLKNNRV